VGFKTRRFATAARPEKRLIADEVDMGKRFDISRRKLLAAGGATAIGASIAPASNATTSAAEDRTTKDLSASSEKFVSQWAEWHDRPWLGADYWANPLQDWRVRDGAAQCFRAAPNRQVHLLTRRVAKPTDRLRMQVRIATIEGGTLDKQPGSAGFRIGIKGPLPDFRNALVFGKGLDCGLTTDGRLFFGDLGAKSIANGSFHNAAGVTLVLEAVRRGDVYDLALTVENSDAKAELKDVAVDRLIGNLALIANFGEANPGGNRAAARRRPQAPPNAGVGTFQFANWSVEGADVFSQDAFGPILFTQYTLSRGTLKLTAQMAPLGPDDGDELTLVEASTESTGRPISTARIDPDSRTATFVVPNWPADREVHYRIGYNLRSRARNASQSTWFTGTIRREPADKATLTVADISCNIHAAFPNAEYVANVKKLDPDLIAFTGDQFYESTGGYGVTVEPHDMAVLDYLRKWYIHGWTWRDLTRDRPSISIPDDHDVYQGNIWGESGAPQGKTQEAGGYRMPAAWVNVVHRTQTSHHPDPYDPAPVKQGIAQYYGRLIYAGIDFAILADRMYKSAPEGKVPPTGGRADHVTDPKFDPRTADLPGLDLLGPGQEKFLAEWADDWKDVVMKAVVSQTIFTAMATTHGGARDVLRADYDTNGWPQTARNRAVELLRKAKAFHIAGDQHLPALVQYGIDNPRDAVYAFAGPAVNVGYPRWWEPTEPGQNRAEGASELTGDFRDHFGNWMTVVAVANGAIQPRATVLEQMADKASGLGIVRFDKTARQITIECWPYLVDPTAPGVKQFAGWPVTVDVPA
jgi:phosphodiesterase/alkaline phosphatase D-like protein